MSEETNQVSSREGLKTAAVTLGGQKFVGGLYWEDFDVLRNVNAAVRERSQRLGFNAAVKLSRKPRMQVGFGNQADGATVGAISIAAAIAETFGDDGLVAVALNDSVYAIVAVEDGMIHSGVDFIGDQHEISDRFQRLLNEQLNFGRPYKRVIAPLEIYPNAEPLDVRDLIGVVTGDEDKTKKSPDDNGIVFATNKKVRTESQRRKIKLASFTVAIALIGAVVLLYGHQQRAAEAAKIAAAAKARLLFEQLHHKAPPAVKPWISQPSVQDLVTSCSEQMAKVPPAIGGWLVTTEDCGPGRLVVQYARMGNATVADLIAAFEKVFHVEPIIKQLGDQASLDVAFAPPAPSQENILPMQDAMTVFLSHFQSLMVRPNIGPAPGPKPLPGQKESDLPPPPPWKTMDFHVDSTPLTAVNTLHYPSLLLSGLELPGLRITQIEAVRLDDAPFLNWSIKGQLYAE